MISQKTASRRPNMYKEHHKIKKIFMVTCAVTWIEYYIVSLCQGVWVTLNR